MTGCASTSGRHDRPTDYGNHGCRCPEARRAFFAARKKAHLRGTRRVDATGARRRLRALKANGWHGHELARQLQTSVGVVDKLVYTGQPTVTARTDSKVRRLFEALWRTPGPSKATATLAARRGWPPPLFWADDRIDDPTYLGEQDFTNERDGIQYRDTNRTRIHDDLPEIASLSAKGRSAQEIADRLGCSSRRVVRLRAVLRAAEPSDTAGTVDDMQRAAS